MASPKMNLCLVLTLITMALHRAESQDCDEFTTVPMDTIAVMNSYTCLTCDYPGGTSQGWFRDGTIIQGDTTLCDCEVFPEDGRICFNSVTEADADTYSCEAIVGFGQVRACTADLILAEPPVIDESNTASLIVTEGNTATIPVSVAGLPSPTVQFMKDGAVLSSSSDSRVTISNTDSDWELTITNVDREDRGDYSIIATNSAGEDTFSRRLLVQFTPVLMVEQSAVDNNMITLTCTAIAYPQPFQNYVRWERVSDGIPLDTTQIFTETDIDFTVTITADVDVSTCEPEGYRCVVNNTRGTTKRSVTLCSGPPNPPAITVTVEGSTSVRVTWGRVTNPLAANYTIEYRPVGDNGAYMNRTVLEDGSASYSETIGGLIQGREYDFRAVSANSAGRSSFSQPRTVQLSSGDPVTGVSVVSTAVDDERAISITWNRYPDAVTAYRILYTLSGETKPEIIVEPDETSYLFRPVECGITVVAYTFQIQAVTSLGEERLSRRVPLEVDCTVPPELPPQTIAIQNVALFGTAVNVTWQVTAGTTVDGLVIRLSEIDSSGVIKVIKNYTVPSGGFSRLFMCVGELTLKTTYEICIVANTSGRASEEMDCYESVVRTLEEDARDISSCAAPTAMEQGSPGPSAEPSNGGIADWVIAVIVVGVLAMVALVFCLMGVFFACHSSQSKGGAEFGSQSSIHTESLSSNMHIHDHRAMSSTKSCFAHHSKGHSTNWNDHADTLKALESGAPTAV